MVAGDKAAKPKKVPFWLHGIFGGTAGAIGIVFVQPADMLKTRMQILGRQGKKVSIMGVTRGIIRQDGIGGLWHGVSCAILRQYTYGLTRFTIFFGLYEHYKKSHGHTPHPFVKFAIGLLAGAGGAVVGNPTEVALIRMTADGQLPAAKRRNYNNIFNALYRIAKEEGVFQWWRGVESTATRAMIVTASEMTSYSSTREILLRMLDDGLMLHFWSSMVAGLVATTVSLPVDIIKTRVQNSKEGLGQIATLKSILRNEGIPTLWSGFWPTFAKLGPHAVFKFVLFEQFFMLYWKIVDLQTQRQKFA